MLTNKQSKKRAWVVVNNVKILEKWKTVKTPLPVAQGLNLHSETLLAVASTEQLPYSSPVNGTSWAASGWGLWALPQTCSSEIIRQAEGSLDLEAHNSHHPLHGIPLLCAWDVLDLPLWPWPYTKDVLPFPGHVLRVSSSPSLCSHLLLAIPSHCVNK